MPFLNMLMFFVLPQTGNTGGGFTECHFANYLLFGVICRCSLPRVAPLCCLFEERP